MKETQNKWHWHCLAINLTFTQRRQGVLLSTWHLAMGNPTPEFSWLRGSTESWPAWILGNLQTRYAKQIWNIDTGAGEVQSHLPTTWLRHRCSPIPSSNPARKTNLISGRSSVPIVKLTQPRKEIASRRVCEWEEVSGFRMRSYFGRKDIATNIQTKINKMN